MATDYRKLRWESVARHYDRGGWLIALTELTIDVDEELLHIPKRHRLTREQALAYPGDVEYGFADSP